MENHKLVMPQHLNHYGFLFGGDLLKWVDEYAYIAATMEYPGSNFVTVAMDKVVFKKSARKGTILKFFVEKIKEGMTSVQYNVRVFHGNSMEDDDLIFSTGVTLVRIDERGSKIPLRKT
ncbi:MAG: hotdog domain-containing protein [Desulfobulbaceae bacterium]|nr:hotdog domain-containing protein [Desulfobulbaceae bacterium]